MAVQSSDDRASARLIAERTLALSDAEPAPRSRRLALLITASLTVVAVAVLGLALWWPPRPDAVAQSNLEAATPVAAQDAGFLNCNAWPSATVLVDGRRIPGGTPVRNLRLTVGTHTVTLLSTDGTQRKEIQVNILPGQTRTIAVSLEPMGVP